MGYQESYIKMTNKKDFDQLVNVIKTNGKEAFDMNPPVEIITLQKTIDTECGRFKKGEKFIYVVGERHGQRNSLNFFEYCKDVPKEIVNNLNMFFTEYFPSEDIFENNETTKLALHEPFLWE
jgi:hypothetical protein